MAAKQCKYGCGQQVEWRGKTDTKGSTGFFEAETGNEHTYERCLSLKGQVPGNQPRQWSSSNKQGHLTQYKVNEIPNAEKIFQILTDIYKGQECLPRIEKLLHDQNILLHTIIEERKGTENPPPKKSEEFGEQGENAASNLEEYDY